MGSTILYLLAVEASAAFTHFAQSSLQDLPSYATCGAFPAVEKQLRTRSLKNTEDDYSTFSDFDKEEEEDDSLAREFYQELKARGTDTNSKNKHGSSFDELFSSPPPPRPTTAGLFSGSGTTIYCSGRSIRAEIEINSKDTSRHPETEKLRWKILSFIIAFLAACIVSEASASGVITLIPGD